MVVKKQQQQKTSNAWCIMFRLQFIPDISIKTEGILSGMVTMWLNNEYKSKLHDKLIINTAVTNVNFDTDAKDKPVVIKKFPSKIMI